MPNLQQQGPAWIKLVGQEAMEQATVELAKEAATQALGETPAGRAARIAIEAADLVKEVQDFRNDERGSLVREIAKLLYYFMQDVERKIRDLTPVETGRLRESTGTTLYFQQSRHSDGLQIIARTGWRHRPGRRLVVQRVVEGGSERGRRAERVIEKAVSASKVKIKNTLPLMMENMVENYMAAKYERSLADG